MSRPNTTLTPRHQAVIDRFTAASQADEQVVAAFLGGSYGRGAADVHSDLDLYVITRDEAYDEFHAGREAFLGLLGEPLFLESFGSPTTLFFILSDGSEGELRIGREAALGQVHSGPFLVLLDRRGILDEAVFTEPGADPAEQREALRHQITWFWHDLSHFTTALARGQLWWAYGQLEALRHYCLNLARLSESFSDPNVGEESYFKIEQAVPLERLAPLRTTFCAQESGAMLGAVRQIVQFYKELAPRLAEQHGIDYPAGLERLMSGRLEALRARSTGKP